jgi:8-oxo-dGTP pyrophosphatase MutT (NUDIX family)
VRVRQGGGVVLLDDRVVLRRNPRGEYLFPKGHLEEGESVEQAAIREVAEEVGVEAEILAELGDISFTHRGEEIVATFFLMRAVRTLPEWDDHLRTDTALVSGADAPRLLSFENYRELWRRAEQQLRSSQTPGNDAPGE